MKRFVNLVMVAVMLMTLLSISPRVMADNGDVYSADLVVELDSGVTVEKFIEENNIDSSQVRVGSDGYILLKGSEVSVLNSNDLSGVKEVVHDGVARIMTTVPNDYYYVPRAGNSYGQWNLKKIGLETVWDDYKCSDDVVIAVVDTGLDYNHPDLQGVMWTNADEVPGNGVDDDGNGYVDDIHGYNFVHDDYDIADDNDHGSAVSSIIGANTDNSLGVAGVCWSASIMSIKVANAYGSASLFNIAQGIRYAVDNGAKVVNLSLGATVDQQNVREAVMYAHENGVTLVAASGNSSSYNSGVDFLYYPAGYSTVIAVGATDENDEVANLSNSSFVSHRGRELDLVAPGVEIVAAVVKNGSDEFAVYDGTSMSVPHVVGTVALMLQKDGALTPDEIDDLLTSNAEKVGDMSGDFDTAYGYGRLDVRATMEAIDAVVVEPDPNPDPNPEPDPDPVNDYGDNYVASWEKQSNYWVMRPGEERSVWVEFTNIGDALWKKTGINAVHLATMRDNDRISQFYDSSSWISPNRIEMYGDENVEPGEVVRFEFDVRAPNQIGLYREYFGLVSEGKTWMNDMGVFWEFEVTNDSVYQAVWHDQSDFVYTTVGNEEESWIEFLNTGTATWQKIGNNAVHLGTSRPQDRSSYVYDDTWLTSNRIEMDQTTVSPGEVGRFSFNVQPSRSGVFIEYFQPVVENLKWLQDWGVYLQYSVT